MSPIRAAGNGTASSTYWGNQSTYPDHLGEARSIPGTSLVMFNGMGHHDMYRGCIGVVDPARGTNFPDGLWKVTAEVPWPEVCDGPVPTPIFASDYHSSGVFGGYKSLYPLSRELFLVSARAGQRHAGNSASEANRGHFELYLMDIHGNRELIHEGRGNVLYAQPLRPRRGPPAIPDAVDRLGSERDGRRIAQGVFYNADVYEGLPAALRGKARQKLDLTLRPDKKNRWGGIFPEPYITLTCGDNAVRNSAHMRTPSRTRPTIAGNFFIWAEPYTTLPPMTRWSYRSPLIHMHLHGKHNDVKLSKEELGKLIAWVDTNCHFRSLADVLRIADPDPNWFLNWPYRPRMSSAPYVSHLHSQDEFASPDDRLSLRDRIQRQ